MKGTRVVVTGGTGFIGTHLVARLVADGADVILAVRANGNAVSATSDGVKRVAIDPCDRASLEAITAIDPEVVFHLAGFSQVAESWRQIGDCFDANAKATALLVEATKSARAFVYASSAEVYGPQAKLPFDESMSPRPLSPYAVSKRAGELSCFARQEARDRATRFAVLRLFNVFGEGQRLPALVPEVIRCCLAGEPVRVTKGEQTRDYLYVDDAIDGLLAAAEVPRVIEGPINLCSGRETAIRDVVLAIARMSGTKSAIELGAIPYRAHETWRVLGDNARAASILGWKPRVAMSDGIAKTIAATIARAKA